MTRAEVTQAAKQLVLTEGPAKVMELGFDLVGPESDAGGDLSDRERGALLVEARVQARRVYSLLGHDAPEPTGVPLIHLTQRLDLW